jgi:hypothetical protein
MRRPVSRVRASLLQVLPLMLLCALLSGIAPRGYMPSLGPDGLHLVLCAGVVEDDALAALADDPGAAALLAALDGSGGGHSQDADTDGDRACPFAGGANFDLAGAFPAPDRILSGPSAPELPQTLIVAARHHAARPPATGPPELI